MKARPQMIFGAFWLVPRSFLRVVAGVMLLVAPHCHAQSPSDADSDSFIKAYSFDVLTALTNEMLDFKVETRELTKSQADCARLKINHDELLVQARPIVLSIFKDAVLLKEVTAFYMSPTGIKMKEFGIATLAEYMSAMLRNLTPPPTMASVPSTFTEQDVRATIKFNDSDAGRQFTRFVKEGLPKLKRIDQLGTAIAFCVASENSENKSHSQEFPKRAP